MYPRHIRLPTLRWLYPTGWHPTASNRPGSRLTDSEKPLYNFVKR
jgi:hypothetical protein